ncbi:hypothetical protein TNCV_3769201 [Trichonephila clavipes]|nr:hypothetical protein TNCV_3769201 [Trichonephila clavipes]
MCSRRHGEVVLEVRRPQKTDISSNQQKGTGAPQLSRCQISFLRLRKADLPKTVAIRLRGGGLYARRPTARVFNVPYGQRSPDLNPIKNVWGALGRQVAGRNYPPTNKNTLIRALTEEWDKLPQQLLDNVVQKVWYDVECCITLHGGHIPY